MTDGFADITSANTVGWTLVKIPQGFSLFSASFRGIGDTDITLGQITITDKNGTEDPDLWEEVAVGKMINGSGKYSSTTWGYVSGSGWADGAANNVTLTSGQGISVNNTIDDRELYFKVSGEVDLAPFVIIPSGFSLWGNPSPKQITLGDIMIVKANGEEASDLWEEVAVGKMINGSGKYSSTTWGYVGGSGWADGAANNITLDPGEALSVNNTFEDYDLYFSCPDPTEKEE